MSRLHLLPSLFVLSQQMLVLHVQGPSNLLPAPESEVVIEDVTDAPAEVSSLLAITMFASLHMP